MNNDKYVSTLKKLFYAKNEKSKFNPKKKSFKSTWKNLAVASKL